MNHGMCLKSPCTLSQIVCVALWARVLPHINQLAFAVYSLLFLLCCYKSDLSIVLRPRTCTTISGALFFIST